LGVPNVYIVRHVSPLHFSFQFKKIKKDKKKEKAGQKVLVLSMETFRTNNIRLCYAAAAAAAA
jgi:hypothetical protein